MVSTNYSRILAKTRQLVPNSHGGAGPSELGMSGGAVILVPEEISDAKLSHNQVISLVFINY